MTALPLTPADLDELSIDDLIHRPGVYVVEVTPEAAKAALARNEQNRIPKERAIDDYARAMATGAWRLTNQGIGFDSKGILTDGQNRLMACIKAGVPFRTVVATGLEPDSREVIDTGVKRSAADAFRMAGISGATLVAAGVAIRFRYETLAEQGKPYTQRGGRVRLSHTEALVYLLEHPSLQERAAVAWALRKVFPKAPTSALLAMESLAVEADPEAAALWTNALLTGAMLSEGDPRLAVRSYLTKLAVYRPEAIQVLGVMVKGWNAWREKGKREVISLRSTEPLPKFDGRRKADLANA